MQHDKPLSAPPSVVAQGKGTDREARSEERPSLEEQDSVPNDLLSMEVTRRRELLARLLSSCGTSGSEGSQDQYYTLVNPCNPTKTFEMSTEQYGQIMSRFTAERAQRSNPASRTVSRNPSEAQVAHVTDKAITPTESRDFSSAASRSSNLARSSDESNIAVSHEDNKQDGGFFSHGAVFSRNAPPE
ncbi:hypothetical protein I204_05547 [Kwoniella mangroviensis CBS 8886]|nr:hypothetical protein I204_05547 [Kwoniella mangroviensis CBS 8886]